jgi:hypothetical protein
MLEKLSPAAHAKLDEIGRRWAFFRSLLRIIRVLYV